MKYAVIGLGEFGSSAAVGLFRKGAEVIAVDVNMDRVNSVKDEEGGNRGDPLMDVASTDHHT